MDKSFYQINENTNKLALTDPVLWFSIVENIFNCSNIQREQDKYAFVLTQLPSVLLNEIRTILNNPPNENPYENLKTNILGNFKQNEEIRLKNLLKSFEIDKKKPSEIYEDVIKMAGSSKDLCNEIITESWFVSLNEEIRVIIKNLEEKIEFPKLIEIADQIWDISFIKSSQLSTCELESSCLEPTKGKEDEAKPNEDKILMEIISFRCVIETQLKEIKKKLNILNNEEDSESE